MLAKAKGGDAMELSFLTEYYVPVILVACLVVGYCIKHIGVWNKAYNKYIPAFMALLGLLLSIPVTLGCGDDITVQSLVGGAVTGLASTGLHQVFKNFINDKEM